MTRLFRADGSELPMPQAHDGSAPRPDAVEIDVTDRAYLVRQAFDDATGNLAGVHLDQIRLEAGSAGLLATLGKFDPTDVLFGSESQVSDLRVRGVPPAVVSAVFQE